jgi:hypothetical protein
MQEEGWVYIIYTTLNPKNGDTRYSFLNIWLCTVKELEILQEYINLVKVFSKKAIQTLPNFILVKYKINTGDNL